MRSNEAHMRPSGMCTSRCSLSLTVFRKAEIEEGDCAFPKAKFEKSWLLVSVLAGDPSDNGAQEDAGSRPCGRDARHSRDGRGREQAWIHACGLGPAAGVRGR